MLDLILFENINCLIICTHKKQRKLLQDLLGFVLRKVGERSDKKCLIQNPDVNSEETSSKGDEIITISPNNCLFFSKTSFHAQLCH